MSIKYGNSSKITSTLPLHFDTSQAHFQCMKNKGKKSETNGTKIRRNKFLEEPEITAENDLLHEKASAVPMHKVLPM